VIKIPFEEVWKTGNKTAIGKVKYDNLCYEVGSHLENCGM
jgi:hypothetical protein